MKALTLQADISIERGAVISDDGAYRYLLWRSWDRSKPSMSWVMLNPSTADGNVDDPTIRRCIGFARREGCGGINVVNLYALRSTDPRALGSHPDPVGPENVRYLDDELSHSERIVAAWGAWATTDAQAKVAAQLLPDVMLECLGKTRNGSPRHPLYVRADQPFEVWS